MTSFGVEFVPVVARNYKLYPLDDIYYLLFRKTTFDLDSVHLVSLWLAADVIQPRKNILN
jgi:hypothetical protein